MGNPSEELVRRASRPSAGPFARSLMPIACLLGLVGGTVIGACAGTDQNAERQRLLDELSFDAPERAGETVTLDAAAVDTKLGELARNEDLSRYIL